MHDSCIEIPLENVTRIDSLKLIASGDQEFGYIVNLKKIYK